MQETIALDSQRELVFIDHHLFTEFLQLQGEEKANYRHFLKNTLPQFLKDKKKERPSFFLYLPDFSANHLIGMSKQDEELERIVSLYVSHQFIKQFGTEDFFPDGKSPSEALTLKEEQVFYKTLLDDVRSQDMTKDILLITGPAHARLNADGMVDAGIVRIGCHVSEDGYIEYKIVEPVQGDEVVIQGKTFKLGKKMTAGGEAAIFELGDANSDFIAKIYCTSLDEQSLKPNCVKFRDLMKKRSEKLEDFFANPNYQIKDPQLIFPLLPIYDKQGVMIGVIMKKVKDGHQPAKQLHDIIMNDSWPFEGFQRLDLLNISHQIVKKVKKVHDHGIIIGDINLRNFLVTGNSSETLKVYLIDLDGCQIEGHPSYYETPNYRDPLWDFASNKPRTAENEVFTLLVLLFEIIHLGVHPYSYTGGSGRNIINDCQENMQRRDFPYVKGKPMKSAQGMFAPPEARFIFSHMPKPMCNLFRAAFGQDENGASDYRPSIDEVIEKVEGYVNYVKKFSDNNELRFTNFGIPKKHRVEFECSHQDCKGKTHYRHIKDIISRLEDGKVEKYLFCGKHLQNYHNIKKMEKKASSEEERNEFRKLWQSQHEERDIVSTVDRFFAENADHDLKAGWETTKAGLSYRGDGFSFGSANRNGASAVRPSGYSQNVSSASAARSSGYSQNVPPSSATRSSSRSQAAASSEDKEKSSILNFLNSLFK
ncbi:lipopolysaccharide kinase InaA family protein [Cytobacillus oceanisediminis]|uniref:lipopolysaccharide kinase InaA family protein n=1 Tax=Cytobacillus oceanisediminis TaxID=665099 RepID=UPI0024948929|nr:lipopolysaccharide kinase InaA family protein [Cytobacillus oceanisediminis]